MTLDKLLLRFLNSRLYWYCVAAATLFNLLLLYLICLG
jgi:hypothetical protein